MSRDVGDEIDWAIYTVGNSRLDLMLRMVIRAGKCDHVIGKLLFVVFSAVMNRPQHCRNLGFNQKGFSFFSELASNSRDGTSSDELDFGCFYDLAASIVKWYNAGVDRDSGTAESFERLLDSEENEELVGFASGQFHRFKKVVSLVKFSFYPPEWIKSRDSLAHHDDNQKPKAHGYCYLQLLRAEHVSIVREILGPNPTIFSFIMLCWQILKPYGELSDYAFDQIAKHQWHVEENCCSETMACNMRAEIFEEGSIFNKAYKDWSTVGGLGVAKEFDEILRDAKLLLPTELVENEQHMYYQVLSEMTYGQKEMTYFPDGLKSLRRYIDGGTCSQLISSWQSSVRYLALTMAIKAHNDETAKLIKLHDLIKFMASLQISNMTTRVQGCAMAVSESINTCMVQRRYWARVMHQFADEFVSLGRIEEYHNEESQQVYEQLFAKLLEAVAEAMNVSANKAMAGVSSTKRAATTSDRTSILSTDSRYIEVVNKYKSFSTKDLPGYNLSTWMWLVLPAQERKMYRRKLLKQLIQK